MLSASDHLCLEVYIVRDDGTRFAEHSIAQVGETMRHRLRQVVSWRVKRGTFAIIVDTRQAVNHHTLQLDWRLTVHVDGRLIARCVIGRVRQSVKKVSSIKSHEGGNLVKGKLTFARLRTTDDDAKVTLDPTKVRSIGQIVVDLHRGTRNGPRPGVTIVAESDVGIASERGKKLGGAVRSTAQEIYEDERKYVNFDLYDPEDTPFHRFTFNHRTRPVLELMNIVDVPPVPVQDPDLLDKRKRDEDNDKKPALTLEDVKPTRKALLAARLVELERQVLLATQPKAQLPPEIVDLTGDDSN